MWVSSRRKTTARPMTFPRRFFAAAQNDKVRGGNTTARPMTFPRASHLALPQCEPATTRGHCFVFRAVPILVQVLQPEIVLDPVALGSRESSGPCAGENPLPMPG